MQDKAVLTTEEVSKYLDISLTTIYRMAENKEIPFIKVRDRRLRFLKEDIDEWIRLRKYVPDKPIMDHAGTLTPLVVRAILPKGGTRGMPTGKLKARYNSEYGAIYLRKTRRGLHRWYLDYHDENGKRVQKLARGAKTKGEAFFALAVIGQRIFKASYGLKDMAFEIFADEYLRLHAKPMKRSWKTDESYLKVHLKPFFQGKLLSLITVLDIETYRSNRAKEGGRGVTINRELALLSSMFNKAKDWSYLEVNPVRKDAFFTGVEQPKQRVLTPDEETKLLDASPAHLKPILIMALNTGMRKGEILGLEWNRVDLEGREITLLCTNTKSKRGREIPINEKLYSMLVQMKANSDGSPFVFPNPFSGKPYVDVKGLYSGTCKRAGILGLRFHDLRHTFASRLVVSGVDINTLREILGHGSIRMTQRYVHSDKMQKRDAVERLARKPVDFSNTVPNPLHACDMPPRNFSVNSLVCMN